MADDMGLGKTYQTIAWCAIHPEMRPVVVVCPATLKYNWQREFKEHANLRAEVIEGTRSPVEDSPEWRRLVASEILIINYDILGPWLPLLLSIAKRAGSTLVPDECQRIKNMESGRSQHCRTLNLEYDNLLALSGTPISLGPVDFFPILNMIAPDVFPSFRDFAFKYCNPRQGYKGQWDFRGASNLEELHKLISPFMLRRTKEQVLTELPPKQRTLIPLRVDMRNYEKIEKSLYQWLVEMKGRAAAMRAKGSEALVKLNELRQAAAAAKIKPFLEWLEDWRQDHPGQKIVVFGYHKATAAAIAAAYPDMPTVTGDTSARQKQIAVDRFQTDPSVWLISGNVDALGVGLTLTAAATTATVELCWTPDPHNQADDRVRRIGQKASHCDNYYFLAMGTTDERLWVNIERRSNVSGQVLDGDAPMQEQIVKDILAKYRRD